MGVLRSFLLFIVVSAQLVQAAPVGVSVTGDAEGDLLALSVAGNARTHEGVSVALLGDAANGDDGSGSCQAGHDLGARCIAVSGTGDASNAGDGAASCGAHKYGTTRYAGIGSASCIAVAPAGAASNGGHGEGSCGGNGALTTQCVALAGGDASNGGDGGRSCFLGGVGRCVAAVAGVPAG
ncbi:MAG TPA: hypothetical protein VFH78_05800, partial [Candidatus Thermoplasmatota archaeon]|nr:hypothetical protein [Candidatus Thermoplasmatota archaeon]